MEWESWNMSFNIRDDSSKEFKNVMNIFCTSCAGAETPNGKLSGFLHDVNVDKF